MIRTEQQWREYVDALIDDLHGYGVRYKSALELIDQYRKDSWEATDELAELRSANEKLHEELARCHSQMESMAKQINELTGGAQ